MRGLRGVVATWRSDQQEAAELRRATAAPCSLQLRWRRAYAFLIVPATPQPGFDRPKPSEATQGAPDQLKLAAAPLAAGSPGQQLPMRHSLLLALMLAAVAASSGRGAAAAEDGAAAAEGGATRISSGLHSAFADAGALADFIRRLPKAELVRHSTRRRGAACVACRRMQQLPPGFKRPENRCAPLPCPRQHVHIEGTLEVPLLFELARRNGVQLPYADEAAARAARANFTCLQV